MTTLSPAVPVGPAGLGAYLAETPFPLAFERSWEINLLREKTFTRPVLDLGCGDGIFARMLFREPIDVGLDPNPREVEYARRNATYDELLCCFGDAIPKPDGAFRTVFSNSVLEHIPDLDAVLREVHRVLAPGGSFYVTVPSDKFDQYSVLFKLLHGVGLKALAERYRRFFNRFWHHYHFHSPDGWRQRFEGHGFRVEECHAYGPRALCVMNDFLVPFCLPSMVLKKLLNRWTLFPGLRRYVLAPLAAVADLASKRATHAARGGLVFVHAVKPEAW